MCHSVFSTQTHCAISVLATASVPGNANGTLVEVVRMPKSGQPFLEAKSYDIMVRVAKHMHLLVTAAADSYTHNFQKGLSPDHPSVPVQPDDYVFSDDTLDAVAPTP
jgi:hypothetical protein